MNLVFVINGNRRSIADVPCHATLLSVLRDRLGLLGTKEGCGVGECGACTVLLDGEPVNACLTAAWKAAGRNVITIEGQAPSNGVHPVQEAFVESGAIQCGFCTPGMIMSAYALLKRTPRPGQEEIKGALAGNLCRCTGYKHILDAVRSAAAKMDRIYDDEISGG
ncbi:MAG: (2Fe-2S)-binding protein [Pseudomonadota bacterium]